MTDKKHPVNSEFKPMNEGLNLKPGSVMAQDGFNIKVSQSLKGQTQTVPAPSTPSTNENNQATNVQPGGSGHGK